MGRFERKSKNSSKSSKTEQQVNQVKVGQWTEKGWMWSHGA